MMNSPAPPIHTVPSFVFATANRSAAVPDGTGNHVLPFHRSTVPRSPTVQTSFAPVPVIARSGPPPATLFRFQLLPARSSSAW